MRDPRTLGPYLPQRHPSLIDLIQGAGDTSMPGPAPAMAAAAEPAPSLGQRIAGLASGVGNVIGALPPVNLLTSLNAALQSGRQENQTRAQAQQVALQRAQQEARLAEAQYPAQQALAQAQAREQGVLGERIGSATDPRLRDSLIRGAATGEFRPFEIEPGPAETAATEMVLGITRDQARESLQARNAESLARLTAGLQRQTNLLDNAGKLQTAMAGKLPGIEDEKAMRSEFESLQPVKNFTEVSQAYRVIQKLPATKVGDLTLLVKYMKLVDPGSSVREGELATADNAGGIPAYIRAQYNRLSSSAGRLDDDVRSDFVARAADLYEGYLTKHRGLEQQYRANALRRGIDPRSVVTDFVGEDDAPAAAPQDGPTPQGIAAEIARRKAARQPQAAAAVPGFGAAIDQRIEAERRAMTHERVR